MTTLTISSGARSRIFTSAPTVGLLLAAIAVVLLVLAPLGYRAGWWNYRISLLYLMPYAGYFGVAAAVISAAALVFGFRTLSRGGVIMAGLGLVIGLAFAYVPWSWNHMRGTIPPIHDITTDTANPPQFVAVLPLREAEKANPVTYDPKVGQLQKQGYPDIAPVTLPLPPDQAFKKALDTANSRHWTIVATDPAAGRIEATERSRWMGFPDDIVIRVQPADAGSRIDIRSVSRNGRSDFGVNAKRIRGYIAALHAAG